MVLKVLDNLSSQSVVHCLKFKFDKAFLGPDFKGNIHLMDREVELLRSNAESSVEGLPLTKPPAAPQPVPEQDE